MKRFTEAGRRAIADENWYSALTMALMLPDICGSLEKPGRHNSQQRYEDWCRIWLQPRFTSEGRDGAGPRIFLSAEDCYQARCSVIHSGSAEIAEKKRAEIHRFEFFTSGPHMNVGSSNIDGVQGPKYLQLRVDRFCEEVFRATEDWDQAVRDDAQIQAEKAKLLVIHSPGTTIGAIRWGAPPSK